jgi:Galactose oxidase, central domain
MTLDARLRSAAQAVDDSVADVSPVDRLRELGGRRRRRSSLTAAVAFGLLAVVVGAAIALPRVLPGSRDVPLAGSGGRQAVQAEPVELAVTATQLPTAPLAARRDPAAVWTGRELVVWGGWSGNQAASRAFADGAAYDPRTGRWRHLAPAPLSARSAPVALWTGREMVVWGGNDPARGRAGSGLVDGAAYDPERDSWRRIADAPAGSARSFGKAVLAQGRMVIGGGQDPTSGPRTESLLVYDLARDRWRRLPVGDPVYDLAAVGREVALATIDPATGQLRFRSVDVGDGRSRLLPDFPVSTRPNTVGVERVGLAWTGEELLAAVSADGRTRIAGLDAADPDVTDWRLLGTTAAEHFHPAANVQFDPQPAPMAWAGGRLLAFSPSAIEAFTPATGSLARSTRLPSRSPFCGAGAAVVWTGAGLLGWGGDSCRAGGPEQVDTGVRFDL